VGYDTNSAKIELANCSSKLRKKLLSALTYGDSFSINGEDHQYKKWLNEDHLIDTNDQLVDINNITSINLSRLDSIDS